MLRRHRARVRREARAPDTRLPASIRATLGLPAEGPRKSASPRKRARKRARISVSDSTIASAGGAAAALKARRAKRKSAAAARKSANSSHQPLDIGALPESPALVPAAAAATGTPAPPHSPVASLDDLETSPVSLPMEMSPDRPESKPRRRSARPPPADHSASSDDDTPPSSNRAYSRLARIAKARTAPVAGSPTAAADEDDPDKKETRRLEKLLGIGKKRRSSNAKGRRFSYLQLFGEGDKDLADLADFCEDLGANAAHAEAECEQPLVRTSTTTTTTTTTATTNEPPADRTLRHSLESALDPDATTDEDAHETEMAAPSDASDSGSENADASDEDGAVEDERSPPRKRAKGEKRHMAGADAASQAAAAAGAGYVPPARRVANDPARLNRRIKGLLNRLADANCSPVAATLQGILRSPGGGTSRADAVQRYVAATLDAVREGSSTPTLSPFVAPHAAVARHLAATVDMRVLASVLSGAARRIRNALPQAGARDEDADEDVITIGEVSRKPIFGYVALVGALYTQGAVSAAVIHDLVRTLADGSEKERVELLLLLVRQCGPQLRADDPESLAQIVDFLRERFEPQRAGQVKITVMLDLIAAVKNNRLRKADADEAAQRFAWAAKVDEPLSATVEQLCDDDFVARRWWEDAALPTSAAADTPSSSADINGLEGDVDLGALADSLRLNTGYRRALFGAIMSATSVGDAYAKVDAQGGCAGARCADAVRVVLHCCAAEKGYNPFYALLAARMAGARAPRFALEHAVADLLRVVAAGARKVSRRRAANYAQFVAELLAARALTVAVFRDVELGDDGPARRLTHAAFERLARCIRQRPKALAPATLFAELSDAEKAAAPPLADFLARVVLPAAVHANVEVVAAIARVLGGARPTPRQPSFSDDSD